MASYCLPKRYANAFLSALRDGRVDPNQLMNMTSGDRRKFFEPIVGAENAEQVNALFESKMLLKDKQRGLITWAKNVGGLTEPARRELLDRINRMPDALLNPASEDKFLADLAKQKLGVTVTADEAKEIYDLSRIAEQAKTTAQQAQTQQAYDAYGRAVINLEDRLEAMRPDGKTLTERILNVTSIPRSSISTGDLSAPWQQGWAMLGSENWREAAVRQLAYFKDEEAYQQMRAWMRGDPDYDLIANKSGLSITELGSKLFKREEAIQSNLVEKAWEYGLTRTMGIPNFVRASNRAYTGFINHLRWKSMKDGLAAMRMAGVDPLENLDEVKNFAKLINILTGRATVDNETVESLLKGGSAIFFSPRKSLATAQVFNPAMYANPWVAKRARMMALKKVLGATLYTAAIIGVARAMGSDVNLDKTATDFGLISVGDTKFDVSGGSLTWLRFMGRMYEGQKLTSTDRVVDLTKGAGYGNQTRLSLFLEFLRNKLAPGIPTAIANAMAGSDPVGRPVTLTGALRDNFVPMTIDDFIDFAYEDPGNFLALALSPLTMFGVSMRPPMGAIPGRATRDVWGDKVGTHHDEPMDQKLRQLGIEFSNPARRIRGVELDDKQYDIYQQYAGKYMRANVSQALRTPGFNNLPLGRQEMLIRDSANDAREKARDVMIAKIPGFTQKSLQIQRDRRQRGSPAAIERRANQ